ncbi:hypothetical protein [Arthrobacter sp. 35W]|uniref:hypothetical protein n=1 Tax=Arthrobacter sp. 35W TaxID=1132441 RepID=UPI00040AC7A3|nr:hypothetical protein [Arthrobacter sp. 35W]
MSWAVDNRAVKVARMQLINKWTFLGIPAIILTGSFLLSLAVFAVIPVPDAPKYSGAGQAVMWYFFALGIQSLTLTFPFSQGMSVSRRSFFLGTVGLFAVVALVVSGLYVLLGMAEVATKGWGMNGRMFALQWIADSGVGVQFLFYFALMMLLFILGFWFATVYKRWGATGMLVLWLAVGVLLVGLVALVTWQDWWAPVGTWLAAQGPLGITGWSLLFTALLGGGAYLTLRRATP